MSFVAWFLSLAFAYYLGYLRHPCARDTKISGNGSYSVGGRGGNATVHGNGSYAVGGKGGDAGAARNGKDGVARILASRSSKGEEG